MAESEGALSKLLDLLFDSGHRLSKRAALMVILIAGVGFLDNYLGFSDYYAYEHKVEQVEKIENILHRPDIDSSTRLQLKNLEREILLRKSLIAHLPSLISLINKNAISSPVKIQKNNSGKVVVERKSEIKRNLYWHTFTSAWPFILLMIGFLIFSLTRKIDSNTLAALIVIELFLAGVTYAIALLFLQIPILLENPVYNYVMNTSLSVILMSAIIFLFVKIGQTSST